MSYFAPQHRVVVRQKSDFPDPVGGVVTLEDNTAYIIAGQIDLDGDRIQCGVNSTLNGESPEVSVLQSTGLATPLLTSSSSLLMSDIALTAAVVFDLSAAGSQTCSWERVLVLDSPSMGTIEGYDNFIWNNSRISNSADLTFDGTFNTISFFNVLFDGPSAATVITIPATAVINRRVKIVSCAFVTGSGETGISVSATAFANPQSFILDGVNFSGGGTYISGLTSGSAASFWTDCTGVSNSGSLGHYYMSSNATATDIPVSSTFYKVSGTTTPGPYVERFDVSSTNNRAVFTGTVTGFFRATAVLSCTSSNNQSLVFRFALNGTTEAATSTSVTTSGTGSAQSVTVQGIFPMSTNDYIELFVTNTTSTTGVTVNSVNVTVQKVD